MAARKKKETKIKTTTYSVLIGGYTSKDDAVKELLRAVKKTFSGTLIVKENMFYINFGTYDTEEAANEYKDALGQAGFDTAEVVEE